MGRKTAEQLSDLQDIRDAAARYCHGVDRLDGDWMKSAYWPEATDDHGTFVGNAWAFVDRCMVSQARFRSTLHCILNHSIELAPDGVTANGEIYNVTYLFPIDGAAWIWVGRYLDHYEKRGDEWRILRRVCVHEGTSQLPATPAAYPVEKFRQGSFDRGVPGRPLGP